MFEVTRANSIQISFSILKISLKCVAHLELNLLCSRMNAKDLSLKCRQIIYCVTNAFAGKLLVTQFCKVCNYVFAATSSARIVVTVRYIIIVVALHRCDIFQAEY